MRLTVRTLLAWIDGLLSPEDQAALGEKVQASGVAPKLVSRVNEVIARPALSAPSPAGRGLADDPNTAAEFLDNALAADRLEAFERVCVESDLHLADVGACHRLLAELSREPAAIEPVSAATRGRLLELAATRLDPVTAAGPPRSAAAPASRTVARRAPIGAWISAAAAVALLGLLGGFFVWSVARGSRRAERPERAVAPAVSPREAPPPQAAGPADAVGDVAAATGTAADEAAPGAVAADDRVGVAAAAAGPPRAGTAMPQAIPAREEAADAAVAPPAAAGPAGEQPAANEPPPPSVAANPAATPPAVEQRVPSGDALAIVASPITAGPAAATVAPGGGAAEPSVAAARQADEGVTTVVRPGGPLVHRGEAGGETTWMLLPADAPLADREELLAPPWCHPVVEVDGLTVRLEPCSMAVITRAADGTAWLELVFGRAAVSGAAADARLGVVAGGLRGLLSGVMRQPAGIELEFDREPGGASVPTRRAVVSAGDAEKVWRQMTEGGEPPLVGLAPEVVLPARAAIVWSDGDAAAATLVPPAAEPAWIRSPGGGDRVERGAVQALADALAASPETAAGEALRRLAADRRAENRMIATATLALLGEYRELVVLLSAERPLAVNESQWTALERMTLPLAIARGENSAAALAAAFRAAGPPGKGDTLMAMARGFSDAELAGGAAAALVDALGDGSLAVRRAAIRRLLEIVEPDARRRSTYRADRPDALRDEGIAWWRTQLEQGRVSRGGGRPPAAAAPRTRDDE